MLSPGILNERYAVVIYVAKERDSDRSSSVFCLTICDFEDEEHIRIEGHPFRLVYYRNNGLSIWEDYRLTEEGIVVGSIVEVERRRDWFLRNTGKKMDIDEVLSQLRFGSRGSHGVVFRGIKEAYPKAVVSPDGGIYQDTKPHHPYALIYSILQSSASQDNVFIRTLLNETIHLENYSHRLRSENQPALALQQPWSKNDVGETVALVEFYMKPSLCLTSKYQAVCVGILRKSSSRQAEKNLTGVILAVSKHDESTSTIYAREVDSTDFCGCGQLFQLMKENDFIWENDYVAAQNLEVGSVVTYRKCLGGSYVYCHKVDKKPQDITKIQMDLDFTESVFLGVLDAFPKAKIHPKGLSTTEMPYPCMAVIGLKSATIKNERIQFTTCRDEEVNLKLLCRNHLQLLPSPVQLQLRPSSDKLQDFALVKFVESHHSTRNPIYSAVCVGLLLRFRPKVISITEEPVKIRDGSGKWMPAPGEVLFDSGDRLATGVSQNLIDELDLQPDSSKQRKVVTAGGKELHCSTVATELSVRGHEFKVNALVGAPAPPTDLLIGKDIIDPLIDLKFTLGE